MMAVLGWQHHSLHPPLSTEPPMSLPPAPVLRASPLLRVAGTHWETEPNQAQGWGGGERLCTARASSLGQGWGSSAAVSVWLPGFVLDWETG